MGDRRVRRYIIASTVTSVTVAVTLAWTLGALGRHLIGSGGEEVVILLAIMGVGLAAGTVTQQSIRGSSSEAYLTAQVVVGFVGGLASSTVYVVYTLTEAYRVALYAAAFFIGAAVGVLLSSRKRWLAELEELPAEPRPLAGFALLSLLPLAAYVLVTRISLAHAGAMLGLLTTTSAMVGIGVLKTGSARSRSTAVFAGVTVLLLAVALISSADWTERPEQRLLKNPIIYRHLDRFLHLIITNRGHHVRLYLNGMIKISSKDEAIYSDILVHPAMTLAPSRARVLLLGGGDGMLLREILRYDDVEKVTVAHLDPQLVELASTHVDLVRLNAGAFSDPRVELLPLLLERKQPTVEPVWMRNEHRVAFHAPYMEPVARRQVARVDVDTLLDNVGGQYDVAIVDLPDPRNLQAAKFYSVEVFRALRQRLTGDAVLALQSTSVFYAKRAFLCVGTTLRAAGFSTVPYHQNVPSRNEWGFYVARPGPMRSEQMLARLRSIDSLSVETRFATPKIIAASTFFGKTWLASDVPIIENSRTKPTLLAYYLSGWDLF